MRKKIEGARENLMLCGRAHLTDASHRNFSISEITAECGLGTGTFYRYFQNKTDFVMQVIEADWDGIIRDITEHVTAEKSNYENVKYIYGRVTAFETAYNFTALGFLCKEGELLRHEKENFQKLYDAMTAKLRGEKARGKVDTELSPEKIAFFTLQLCFAAGKDPEISFDDLWNFLHIGGS